MLLNCDLGESFGAWQMGLDSHAMQVIDLANIACGFHAGDPDVMAQTLTLAKQHNVQIGAHPSYPDKQGFGRRSMKLSHDELVNCLHYQIAALDGMAQVHGLSIGYAGMVKHYLDIEIDKSDSRTDWTKRPLSESQLAYARTDVEHLITIYPKLAADLAQTNWLDAAKQETQLLIDKKYAAIDVDSLYLNLKMAWRLNAKQLNALKYLATWRYNEAVKKNRPLGFIAKDHTLIGVAQVNPKSVGAMLNIEGVEPLDVKHKGKAMLNVLKKANAVEPEQYPERIRRLDDYPGYKQVFKRVKQFIASKAEQHEQLTENFASKKQINQFLTWHYQHNNHADKQSTVDILNHWRFEIFGSDLILSAKSNFAEL